MRARRTDKSLAFVKLRRNRERPIVRRRINAYKYVSHVVVVDNLKLHPKRVLEFVQHVLQA